jgi:hypothetical protein
MLAPLLQQYLHTCKDVREREREKLLWRHVTPISNSGHELRAFNQRLNNHEIAARLNAREMVRDSRYQHAKTAKVNQATQLAGLVKLSISSQISSLCCT